MDGHSMPTVPGSTIAMVVVLSFAIMAAGIAIGVALM
jgi:hypothetical protein